MLINKRVEKYNLKETTKYSLYKLYRWCYSGAQYAAYMFVRRIPEKTNWPAYNDVGDNVMLVTFST